MVNAALEWSNGCWAGRTPRPLWIVGISPIRIRTRAITSAALKWKLLRYRLMLEYGEDPEDIELETKQMYDLYQKINPASGFSVPNPSPLTTGCMNSCPVSPTKNKCKNPGASVMKHPGF